MAEAHGALLAQDSGPRVPEARAQRWVALERKETGIVPGSDQEPDGLGQWGADQLESRRSVRLRVGRQRFLQDLQRRPRVITNALVDATSFAVHRGGQVDVRPPKRFHLTPARGPGDRLREPRHLVAFAL